jgi:hypothetical protein
MRAIVAEQASRTGAETAAPWMVGTHLHATELTVLIGLTEISEYVEPA